jgi:site-specific recombinase XerD
LIDFKISSKNSFPNQNFFFDNHHVFSQKTSLFIKNTETWLQIKSRSPATYKSYNKEVERFFLWCFYKEQISVEKLEIKDVLNYSYFLTNVLKTHPEWCGDRVNRKSKNWKPFNNPKNIKAKGLSDKSHDYSMSVISALFTWMVDNEVLSKNVFKSAQNKSCTFQENVARAFTWDEITVIYKYIDSLPEGDKKQRLRWLCSLMVSTGMRCNEIASSYFGLISKDSSGYLINIVGKGNKHRGIPLSPDLIKVMEEYRFNIGLTPTPAPGENTPLVSSLRDGSRIGVRAINKIVKDMLLNSSEFSDDLYVKNKFIQGSPHWFRGSFASEVNKHGVNQKTLQDLMGHSSLNTTSRYLLIDSSDKIKAVSEIHIPI